MKKTAPQLESWEEKLAKKNNERTKKTQPTMKVSGKRNLNLKKIITNRHKA